jgi:hypothetical protein
MRNYSDVEPYLASEIPQENEAPVIRSPSGTIRPSVSKRQAGVFSVGQALESGVTRAVLRRMQRSGKWVKVLGRGWADSDQEIGILQRCWAAALTWSGTVIFGGSALLAWNAIDPRLIPALPLSGESPILMAGLSDRHQKTTGLSFRQASIEVAKDWPTKGLPLADPYDSIIDALATLPEAEADSLFAWLAARRLISRDELADGVERYYRRNGCG